MCSNISAMRDPEIVRLESETHEALTPWIEEHKERGAVEGSRVEVTDLGYDPDRYPAQRLDVALTPVKRRPLIPKPLLFHMMHRAISRNLGSADKTDAMIKTFRETLAFESSPYTISEEFHQRIEAGETLGVISDHTDRGDLRDLAYITAGIVLALNTRKIREQTFALVGLNISRQAINDQSVVDKASDAFGIIWVIQDTDSRKALSIPEEAVSQANRGALRVVNKIRERGGIIGVVAAGSAMDAIKTDDGPRLRRPEVSSGTIGILRRLDGLLPVGMASGVVLPGPMHIAQKGLSHREDITHRRTLVFDALYDLAQNNADLTGLPIIFDDEQGNEVTVFPQA